MTPSNANDPGPPPQWMIDLLAWMHTQVGMATALSILGLLISYLVYRDNARTKQHELQKRDQELLLKQAELDLKQAELDLTTQREQYVHARRRPHMELWWASDGTGPSPNRMILELTNCDERPVVLRWVLARCPGHVQDTVAIVKIQGAIRRRPFSLIWLDPLQTCRIHFDINWFATFPAMTLRNFRASISQAVSGCIDVRFSTGETFSIDLPREYRQWLTGRMGNRWLQLIAQLAMHD